MYAEFNDIIISDLVHFGLNLVFSLIESKVFSDFKSVEKYEGFLISQSLLLLVSSFLTAAFSHVFLHMACSLSNKLHTYGNTKVFE